jgi:hypothetical protein
MRVSTVRHAAIVLFVAGCATASQTPVTTSGSVGTASGMFVTTLGTDTIAIERYRRTANRLEGDYVSRFQGGRTVRYVADLAPDGRVRSVAYTETRLGANAPPATVTTTTIADGTATVAVQRGGVADTARSGNRTFTGLAIGRFPGVPPSAAIYEQMLIAAHPAAGDSAVVVLLSPGNQPAPSTWIVRTPTGYRYHSTFFGGWTEQVVTDPSGQIVSVDATAGTTVGTVTRRASSSLDFDRVAQAWSSLAASGGLQAQASPPDTVRATVGAANIEIAYSRPFRRGRTIFGSNVVPYDRVWRTGANAATQITTSRDLMFGTTHLPAGKYTLWTLPSASGTKLIINSQTGQWGTEYDPKRDVARIDLTTKTLDAPTEQFTIRVDPAGQGGVLKLAWDRTEFSIPFTVM